MSQSRELQLHIAQMLEIRSLLNAMKNLALMEIHKLAKHETVQCKAVAFIETTAQDFLNFYPLLQRTATVDTHICLLIGAERGFCGDFNENLIQAISQDSYTGMIAIGTRLNNKLADSAIQITAELEGANIAEEVPAIISRLIETISHLHQQLTVFNLIAVYQDNTSNQIIKRQILPPFLEKNPNTVNYRLPPVLNLEPAEFFSGLIDHYLFTVLHEIFYISLLAENHHRLQHLEGSVKHLDDETVTLQRKAQVFRQEEITEEIEVILLNAENL